MSNPFKPDLEKVSTNYLAAELYRRQRSGECLVLILTPEDIAEYWECDESGATHPGSRVPEAEEMRVLARAFERWQDNGIYSDLMDTLRRAWQAEQARQLDQEGGSR